MLRQTEVKSVTVPRYSELNVKSFWSQIKKTPKYLAYFQDYKPSQLPERDFMFETLLTIDEQFVVSKVKQAELGKLTRNRHGDDEKILITKCFWRRLKMLNTTLVSIGLNYFYRIKRKISSSSQEVCKSWIQEKEESCQRFVCRRKKRRGKDELLTSAWQALFSITPYSSF